MTTARATAIFDADDGKLQEVAKNIQERLAKLQEGFEGLKETAIGIFVIEKLPELYEKISEGIEKVLETGSHFHDLASNTGATVEELVILEEQFRASGKAAEDIQPTLAHMQKALEEGTAGNVLSELGVDLEELRSKTPIQQFQTLGKAIAGLKNPTDAAYAAMQLFGKSGGTLISLFREGEGFEGAAERVGQQAQILNEDAAFFHEASTKLSLAGLKTRGFFIGLADQIVPVLMPLLDRFEKLDLSAAGKGVGTLLNSVASADDPARVIVGGLLIGGVQFVELIADGLATAVTSLGNLLMGVAHAFMAEIDRGLAEVALRLSHIPGLGGAGTSASTFLTQSAAGQQQAMLDSKGAIGGWKHTGLMDSIMVPLIKDFGMDVGGALANAMKAHGDALAKNPEVPGSGGVPELGFYQPNVSHLASLGGAFGQFSGLDSDPIGDKLNDTNSLLTQIRDRLPADKPGMKLPPGKTD